MPVDISRATTAKVLAAASTDDLDAAVRGLMALVGSEDANLAAICFDAEDWARQTVAEREGDVREWLALVAPTDRRCGTCRFYDPENEIPGDPPEEQMSWCTWPADSLPWSLRWGARERMTVGPLEGAGYAQWKGRPRNPVVPDTGTVPT